MRTFEVDVVLMDGTQLSFTITKEGFGLTRLGDGYVLTGYKLWKERGNVLCGEEVEYKELSIKIKK